MSDKVETLLENAISTWIGNKLRRAGSVEKKRTQSEYWGRISREMAGDVTGNEPEYADPKMDRGNFVKQAVGEGPKTAHALTQNLDIPTFLRGELKNVIGPYRPFAPGTKHVGEGGKVVHVAGPHAFYDAGSGQRVNSDSGTVTLNKGADPRKVESPMNENKTIVDLVLEAENDFEKLADQLNARNFGAEHQGHLRHVDTHKPPRPCTSIDMNFGGSCFNCGYDPQQEKAVKVAAITI